VSPLPAAQWICCFVKPSGSGRAPASSTLGCVSAWNPSAAESVGHLYGARSVRAALHAASLPPAHGKIDLSSVSAQRPWEGSAAGFRRSRSGDVKWLLCQSAASCLQCQASKCVEGSQGCQALWRARSELHRAAVSVYLCSAAGGQPVVGQRHALRHAQLLQRTQALWQALQQGWRPLRRRQLAHALTGSQSGTR
jgi:hypothetical protein